MIYFAILILGYCLGVASLIALLNWDPESKWHRHNDGWKRKIQGRWQYTEDQSVVRR